MLRHRPPNKLRHKEKPNFTIEKIFPIRSSFFCVFLSVPNHELRWFVVRCSSNWFDTLPVFSTKTLIENHLLSSDFSKMRKILKSFFQDLNGCHLGTYSRIGSQMLFSLKKNNVSIKLVGNKQVWVDAQWHWNRKVHFSPNFLPQILFEVSALLDA